jgi:hypothetical protein
MLSCVKNSTVSLSVQWNCGSYCAVIFKPLCHDIHDGGSLLAQLLEFACICVMQVRSREVLRVCRYESAVLKQKD